MMRRVLFFIMATILIFGLFACSDSNDKSAQKDEKKVELDDNEKKEGNDSKDENSSSDDEEENSDNDDLGKENDSSNETTETEDDYQDFQNFDELSLEVRYTLIKSEDGVNTSYLIRYMIDEENERFEITSNQKRNFIVYNRDDNRTYIWDDDAVGKIEKGRVIDFIYLPPALNSKAILSEDFDAQIEKNEDTLNGTTKQFIDDEHGIADASFTFYKGAFFPSKATYTFENMTLSYTFEQEIVKESFRENTFKKPEMIQFESEEYNTFSLNPDLKGNDLIKTFPESYNFSFGTIERVKIFIDREIKEFSTNNLFAENGKFLSSVIEVNSLDSSPYAKSARESDSFLWWSKKASGIDKNFGTGNKEDAYLKLFAEKLLYRDMSQTLKSESENSEIINAELVQFQGEECVLVERAITDKVLGKINENSWYSVKNKYPVKRILKHNGSIIFESETNDIKPNAEYKPDDFSL